MWAMVVEELWGGDDGLWNVAIWCLLWAKLRTVGEVGILLHKYIVSCCRAWGAWVWKFMVIMLSIRKVTLSGNTPAIRRSSVNTQW
jgi:hypothetical protein